MIIEMDTRNQKDSYVTKYFDKEGIKWIRNKLYTGDVKLLNDTRVIIDLKANTEEIAHNLCNTTEHLRIKKELEKAKGKIITIKKGKDGDFGRRNLRRAVG